MLIPALSAARRGKIIWLFAAFQQRTSVYYFTKPQWLLQAARALKITALR